MKIFNWKKTIQKVKEVLSVKEQQRIAKGLEYLNDDSVGFSINGEKQQLCYEMNEYREVQDNRVLIHRQYWYYYWNDFFQFWSRACGSGECFEENK
jgi:hypothetical protein